MLNHAFTGSFLASAVVAVLLAAAVLIMPNSSVSDPSRCTVVASMHAAGTSRAPRNTDHLASSTVAREPRCASRPRLRRSRVHIRPSRAELFDRPRTRETTVPPLRPVTPVEAAQVANPDLPVVGEAIWTSADGLDITMRIAVHAVRRVAGGTVLDWSVTPLHGPGLQPNDPLPRTFDLGLTRPGEGYPNILLVDAARSRVYRPLTLKGSASGCLCTPVTVVQQNLRIDYTTLLQVAFPPLPNDLAAIDVQLATVPPFWQVPVTPAGMLPLASYATELTRARRSDAGSCQYQGVQLPPGRAALPRHDQWRLRQQQLHLDCVDYPVARGGSRPAVGFESAVRGRGAADARLQPDLGGGTSDSAGQPRVASSSDHDQARRSRRVGMPVHRFADRGCRDASVLASR